MLTEEKIRQLVREAEEKLSKAADLATVDEVRVSYLGKKGKLTEILKGLKELSVEDKRRLGPIAQKAREQIDRTVGEKFKKLETELEAEKEWIDVTAPGVEISLGHPHPLSVVQRDIEEIFSRMGFEIVDGPEVETEFYNFDAVNVPADHPARDMQDTFWLETSADKPKRVLRTHTTNVQVRYMKNHTPPFRIIIPGRVFRNEATDSTHEHTFHQFEVLVVGDNVGVANFLDIAQTFFSAFFGRKLKVRLRPSFFPFVEPGFEFDISCTSCGGSGLNRQTRCGACKGSGWLEVGGAGMVHPNLFAVSGYEKGKYTGFAWGFGLERLAMMKYKIDDIRLFHSGDVRLSRQFR